jgi:hypothetical protein
MLYETKNKYRWKKFIQNLKFVVGRPNRHTTNTKLTKYNFWKCALTNKAISAYRWMEGWIQEKG